MRDSFEVVTFEPGRQDGWDEAYSRLKELPADFARTSRTGIMLRQASAASGCPRPYSRKSHMTLPVSPAVPGLSGDRFRVTYQISGTEAEARSLAETARVEQSVEFPAELVPDGDIRDRIMGQLEAFEPCGEGRFLATISFAVESAGAELTQLINLLWGTGSFFPGFRVERAELPPSLLAHYRGPRFGVTGLRERVKIYDRPLLCTAIKPMGLTPQHLAEMAYACALGGMDFIKDDHGITDQPFCRFEERVALCAEAVARANRETGLLLPVSSRTSPAPPTGSSPGPGLPARRARAGS